MDISFIAQSERAASILGIKNEPFDGQTSIQHPPTPHVGRFPPQMRGPRGPTLELFDLNDAFALPKTRLAQLAQRTPPKNAEKFIIQVSKILGILPNLPENKKAGKDVLEFVFTQIIKFKRAGTN
jgi:intraflagellar transport protein 52